MAESTVQKGGKVRKVIMDYLVISIGVVIYSLAWIAFMLPNNISSGGLTGACAILNYGTGIPVSLSYLVLNSLLLILGSVILGVGFGFKTVYAMLLSSLLFELGPKMTWLHSVPGNFLYVQEMALVPLIGGILEATGIAIIFSRGGSTGGTDIIALIVNKYWPISPGTTYLVTDLVIISTILLIPGKGFQDIVYGYIMMVTFSVVIDRLLLGGKSAVQVLIFSDRNEDIAKYIANDMERGVTSLYAQGWYTKKDKKVLLVLILKTQVPELSKYVKKVDPRAFMSVVPATGVYGEGFEEIKTGIDRDDKKKASPADQGALGM